MGSRRATHHRNGAARRHDVPGTRRDSLRSLHANLPAHPDFGDLRLVDSVWRLAPSRPSRDTCRGGDHDPGRAADHGTGVSDRRRRKHFLLPLRRADSHGRAHPWNGRRVLHRCGEPCMLLPAGSRAQRRLAPAPARPAPQSVCPQLTRLPAGLGEQHGRHHGGGAAGNQSRPARTSGRRTPHRSRTEYGAARPAQRRHRPFDCLWSDYRR